MRSWHNTADEADVPQPSQVCLARCDAELAQPSACHAVHAELLETQSADESEHESSQPPAEEDASVRSA